ASGQLAGEVRLGRRERLAGGLLASRARHAMARDLELELLARLRELPHEPPVARLRGSAVVLREGEAGLRQLVLLGELRHPRSEPADGSRQIGFHAPASLDLVRPLALGTAEPTRPRLDPALP